MNKLTLVFLIATSVIYSQKKTQPKPVPFSTKDKTVTVYTSADSTNLRLTKTDNLQFQELKQPLETQTCIFVNPDKKYQTFVGIGGAITDASAEVFAKLSPAKQEEFLNAYYSKDKGIGYTLLRTNMNSCDFSSASYTYVQEGDKELKSFNIDHDRQFKIPLLKKAIATIGKEYTFYISPWSPPAFMKDNNDMLHGGKLLPEFHQSWANYYVKYINELEKKEGLRVWGLTVQNEPMAKQTWESCIFSAADERDFLKNYLGPTLKKAGLGDKKITVWDHNRDLLLQRTNTILEDPIASQYVWGIGFHWYEDWSGGEQMYDNVGKVNELYPDKKLMFTEGCNDKFNANNLQLWKNGERYGKSMINDFNNGTVAWTDWNILLDQFGGPNHVKNFCFAPIHSDTATGELIYTPSYYFIGHFSKFIGKNARRISAASSRSQLLTTSFLNTDGKVVTVVLNQSNKKVTYNLCIGTAATEVTILPNAIQTLVY
ncbi:glycoside hydrolase family 30 protein [Flavobacterium sp.]